MALESQVKALALSNINCAIGFFPGSDIGESHSLLCMSMKEMANIQKLWTISALPILLPEVKSYQPSGTGESPLATIPEWVNTTDPENGLPARRETNTMPQWAGSSWYYLRYLDPSNDQELVSKEAEHYWMPVDLYIGGAEHAVTHLLVFSLLA